MIINRSKFKTYLVLYAYQLCKRCSRPSTMMATSFFEFYFTYPLSIGHDIFFMHSNSVGEEMISVTMNSFISSYSQHNVSDGCTRVQIIVVNSELGSRSVLDDTSVNVIKEMSVGNDCFFL